MTEHRRDETGQPDAAPSGNVPGMSYDYPALESYAFRPIHRRMRVFGRCAMTWTAAIGALCIYLKVYEMALWMAGIVAMWFVILSSESAFANGFRHAQDKAAERAAEAAKEQATRAAEERLAWQTATAAELAALEGAARRQQMEWEASADAERIAREAAEVEVERLQARQVETRAQRPVEVGGARTRGLAGIPKPVKTVARATCDGEGFIYVILFSTGAIKVGQTVEPRTRLSKHRRDAEVYGVTIVDYWVSPQHANYVSSETMLIKQCRRVGTPVKKEYFLDLGFTNAVEIAGQLPFVRIAAQEVAAR
jgi:hypothetical protein